MSFSKVISGRYENIDALEKCINYCAGENSEEEKCESWSGYGVITTDLPAAINSMKAIRRLNFEVEGKQLKQIMISISRSIKVKSKKEYEEKVRYENSRCDDIGEEIAYLICQHGFQTLYFKHVDSTNLHLHFVVNTVNFMNGSLLTNVSTLKNMIDNYLKMNFKYMQWRFSY